jgi:hypothetical protein
MWSCKFLLGDLASFIDEVRSWIGWGSGCRQQVRFLKPVLPSKRGWGDVEDSDARIGRGEELHDPPGR